MSFEQAAERSNRARGLDGFLSRRRGLVSLVFGLCLVAIYQADDSIVEEGDAVANVELATNLLRTGKFHFSPRTSPIVFLWRSSAPLEERDDFYVRSWRQSNEGKPAGFWYGSGKLRFNGPRYFVVKSPVRDAYVCTFGIIAGISMLPMAAVLAAVDDNFTRTEWMKLTAAKLHASGLIALSAVLIFLIGLRYVRPRYALGIAASYALGTCVWAISSETLWQQTVNIALLAGVAFTFVKIVEDHSHHATWICGLLLGIALASRPTALFVLLAVAGYLWLHRREALPSLLWAALPVPLLVAIYNQYYFGSPLNFGQELVGHTVAMAKTGTGNVWQTPAVVGLVGLLISPSRGLLVFSPFLAAGFWGAYRVWTMPQFRALRPFTIAAGAMMLLQSKWFDWWGGWAYGYRPWLEATPVLALCLMPVVPIIMRRHWSAALFALALGWSVFVQGLGALAYDKYWNARSLFRVDTTVDMHSEPQFFVTEDEARSYADSHPETATYVGPFGCNIDFRECRYRLWSIEDNVIAFYMGERFEVSRANRTHLGWFQLASTQ
ncbi:MAG TPA: hypothetical protein VJV78_06955 [Polyangiales bacterium]|nr:hypothetical protein [Polyangiales bacterium]